jgi:hypothetical protein
MEKTECQSIQVVDAGSRTIKQATRIVQEWNGITNSFHLENEEGHNLTGDFATRQEAEAGVISSIRLKSEASHASDFKRLITPFKRI